MLFLAILGVGLFAYYQGRSHPFNLNAVIWPAIIMLFLVTDRIVRYYNAGLINAWRLILILPALLAIVLATMTIALKWDKIHTAITSTIDGISHHNSDSTFLTNVKFIRKYAGMHKTVNIFGSGQGIYFILKNPVLWTGS